MILRESVRHGAPRVRTGPGSLEPAGTRPTLLACAAHGIPDTDANDHASMSQARSPSLPADSPAFVRATDRISGAAPFAISVLQNSYGRDGDEPVRCGPDDGAGRAVRNSIHRGVRPRVTDWLKTLRTNVALLVDLGVHRHLAAVVQDQRDCRRPAPRLHRSDLQGLALQRGFERADKRHVSRRQGFRELEPEELARRFGK